MDIFKKLLLNFILVSFISSVLAYSFTFFHLPFIPIFILGIFFQYIFWFFYNQYQERQILLKKAEIELQMEQEYSKQGVELICPCYKKNKQYVPIRLNENNSYSCPDCKKEIAVFVDITTAATTDTNVINPLERFQQPSESDQLLPEILSKLN